jgi:hypothetical protein
MEYILLLVEERMRAAGMKRHAIFLVYSIRVMHDDVDEEVIIWGDGVCGTLIALFGSDYAALSGVVVG